jgi:surface antigen
MRSAIALIAVAFAIAGCTTSRITASNYAEDSGVTSGSQLTSNGASLSNPLLRALDGGLIGTSVGAELNRTDRARALEAEYRALEYAPAGKPVDWSDPDTKEHGEVVAAQPYQVGSQNCRQYTHTVYINEVPQTARGTACRNPDGSWTPLS